MSRCCEETLQGVDPYYGMPEHRVKKTCKKCGTKWQSCHGCQGTNNREYVVGEPGPCSDCESGWVKA